MTVVRVCVIERRGYGQGLCRRASCDAEAEDGERGRYRCSEVNYGVHAEASEGRKNDISMGRLACCRRALGSSSLDARDAAAWCIEVLHGCQVARQLSVGPPKLRPALLPLSPHIRFTKAPLHCAVTPFYATCLQVLSFDDSLHLQPQVEASQQDVWV